MFDKEEDKEMGRDESDNSTEQEEEDEEEDGFGESTERAHRNIFDGVPHSDLKAAFAGPHEPNFMTLHEFRNKGYTMFRYTIKGGKSMDYDMCNKEDF